MDTHDDHAKTGRVSTGDAGLDRVLGGGFMRGSVAIFQGTPGAGKTTLANQMAFANARRGGNTVYITLLSESHGRMTSSLSPMRFFDHGEVGETIHYISGYSVLMEEGARALLQLMATEARSHGADLVVLDGLFVLADAGLSESEYRKFVNDLALQAELMGCTVLLLTNSRRASDSPEYTMVDGWVELGREDGAHRSSRYVEVHKLRGSGFIPGRHRLRISGEGVQAFPRLESYLGHQPRLPAADARITTGVADVDVLLDGGLPAHSNTLLWGASGTGKTGFGLHFLAASSPRSPGLLFTFYESPEECLRIAARRGIELAARVDEGSVGIAWHPPIEHDLDELGHALLARVRETGIRRLVIDGLDAFEKVALEPARLSRFLTALSYELRNAGCTSLFISEVPDIFGHQALLMTGNRSSIAQNILLLRYAQDGAL
ncbi:MAG TPA: ATPase domain-containing protein, partial [Lysobacter sp.]